MTVGELVWKVTGDTSDLNKSLDKSKKSIGGFGGGLKKINLSTAALIAGAVAAAKKLFDLSKSAGAYADKLLDLEQITGISTDNLQRLEVVAVEAGVSFEGLAGSVQKLTARIPQIEAGTGEAAKAMDTLGINIKDVNGELKSGDQLFDESIKALQNVENQTQRNALAQQVFGRSLQDVAPVLGFTNQEYDNLKNKADELGTVIDGKALASANRFRAALETLQLQSKKAGIELGATIAPAFEKIIVLGGGIAAVAKEAGKDLTESFGSSIADNFKGIAEEIGKLASTIFLGANGFQILAGTVKIVGAALSLLTQIIKTTYDSVIGLVRIILDVGIGAFKALFKAITGDLDGAREALQGGVLKAWEDIKDTGLEIAKDWKEEFFSFTGLIKNFGKESQETADKLAATFSKSVDTSTAALDDALEKSGKRGEKEIELAQLLADKRKEIEAETLAEIDRRILASAEKRQNAWAAYENAVASAMMLTNAFGELATAITDNEISDIDEKSAKELKAAKAAGASEEQLAVITEKAEKKKAEAKYKGELANWSLKLAEAAVTAPLMVMNAYNAGAAIPVAGVVLGPVAAAAAGVAAAVQVAALIASRPKPPAFANGGIIQGSSSGQIIRAGENNTSEAVVNPEGALNLVNEIAQNGGAGGGRAMQINIMLDGQPIAESVILDYVNNGVVTIDSSRGIA